VDDSNAAEKNKPHPAPIKVSSAIAVKNAGSA
jgi:hypothetical protein